MAAQLTDEGRLDLGGVTLSGRSWGGMPTLASTLDHPGTSTRRCSRTPMRDASPRELPLRVAGKTADW